MTIITLVKRTDLIRTWLEAARIYKWKIFNAAVVLSEVGLLYSGPSSCYRLTSSIIKFSYWHKLNYSNLNQVCCTINQPWSDTFCKTYSRCSIKRIRNRYLGQMTFNLYIYIWCFVSVEMRSIEVDYSAVPFIFPLILSI